MHGHTILISELRAEKYCIRLTKFADDNKMNTRSMHHVRSPNKLHSVPAGT